MTIAILGSADSWYVADLSRAAADRGHSVARWDYAELAALVGGAGGELRHGHEPACGADALIVRTMPPGSLEQVVFRMNLLGQLEASGCQVLNPPRAIECAVDKYLTTAVLDRAGLPVPETFVCETADLALEALPRLGGDVVVKPLFGSEGRGIVRVSDPDLGLRVFRAIERTGGVLYLQRFIQHGGFDVRVLVLDGQVIGAIRRRSADDFRTNVSRNAVAERHQLTEREAEMALRATFATGTRLAGVDLLYDLEGALSVIEVNAVPGWQAFQKATGFDVAAEVIRSIEHPP
jgi:ribosomal protein S6--L-glutamate ligase